MASTLNGSLPGDLATRLKRLESRIRRLALLRGIGILAMVLAAGIGVGTLIDLKWELSVGFRFTMLAIVGLCAAGAAVRYLLWPGFAKLSQAELASLVENAHPELAERLSSTVELNDPAVPEEHRGSMLMREMLTEEAVSNSTRLDFNQSVSSSRAARFSLTGLAAVLLLLTPFLYSPSGYGLLWQRFFSPWGNFESGGNLYFEVENGNRVVARGSDVVIQAKPKWRRSQEKIPDSVLLTWKDSAGEEDFRRMDFQKDSGDYLTTIPNVFNTFEFDISAGRARTERFHVSVVEAPAVTSAMLDVQPPAYTGMNALHHDGVVGEIPVYRHSGLKFQLQFNKPVEQAELVLPETENVNQPEQHDRKQQPTQLSFVLSADRKSAVLETTAETGGQFRFLLTDEHGLLNQQEPRRVLVITPDEAPVIQLAGSDRPRQARPTDTAPVDLLATDDIGVTELELHYEILNGERGKLTTDPAKLGSREVFHRFDLDLSSLNLKEGDVLTYRVRAADERPVPGPNESWSDPRILTISRNARSLNSADVAEMQKQLEDTLDAIQDDLKQNRERVTELHKNAENNLKRNQEFQQKEKVTELGLEQFQLAQRLEQLSQNFANHPLYQNLKEKTQEVSRQDLPEASQTIRQAADVFPKERVEKLKQNVDQLRQAENKLNEIAQQFDQLAELERDLLDLNRLADETEQLAQQLKNLENRLGNPLAGETQEQKQARERQLAQQQQAVQQEQQQLEEQLDDLMEKRPELAEAARQQELQRLAALARQLQQLAESEDQLAEAFREEMQQQAENNNSQPASEQQQNANQQNSQQQNQNQQNPQQQNANQQNPQQQHSNQQNANQQNQNQQNSNQPNSQQQQSPARQAQAQQQQLARNAAQLALDVARRLGPESQTAQQAARTAQQCFT